MTLTLAPGMLEVPSNHGVAYMGEVQVLTEGAVRLVGSRRTLGAAVAAIAALALLGSAGPARAASSWTVTTTADDAVGNPALCSNGQCPTLRDAVAQADSDSGDTIVLPASSQPYQLLNGELPLTSNMQIQGAGPASVTINANSTSRVFEIPSGVTVTVSGITLTGGNSSGVNAGAGGAIYVAGVLNLDNSSVTGNTASTSGGGIDTNGTLNVDHSTISENRVNSGYAIGGGIDCFCTQVTVTDSTISGNSVLLGSGNQGGAIQYTSSNPLVLSGSTISGNGAQAAGGGLYLAGPATLTNDTITGNLAGCPGTPCGDVRIPGTGGGIDQEQDGLSMTNLTLAANDDSGGSGANYYNGDSYGATTQNTIFAAAPSGETDCDGVGAMAQSQGGNLQDENPSSSSRDCWYGSQSTDQESSSANPKLGPLADNGGPTQTMALLPGSAAIDRAVTVSSLSTDQRGGPRPQPPGGAYDVGAYEVGAIIDMSLSDSGSPNPATVGQTVTYTLTATNNGPTGTNSSSSSDPAYLVSVTETLPSGATFQSASASQGSCSNASGTVTCNLGTIAQGASATVSIRLIPRSPGTLTDPATVSSSALDPNTANNTASATVQVNPAPAAGAKPAAVTNGASSVTFDGAIVHGSVNPEGAPATDYFEYGRTTSYGSRTASHDAGSGTSSRSVSQSLTALRANTLYHYRLVAQNANGITYGGDRTFRTPRRPSLHVTPPRVRAGSTVRVYGDAGGCPRGEQVTLLSFAFPRQHEFAGEPAVYARVRSGGVFSTTTRAAPGRTPGRYVITARCGGGNLGVSADLTVLAVVVPRFTG